MRLNPFRKKGTDPFAHDMSGLIRGAYQPKRRKPFILRHKWALISLIVLLLVGSVAGYGLYRYYHLQAQIQEDIDEVDPTERADEPFNILLVGSDSRDGLTEEEQESFGANAVGGQRADTLILARVDPETDHITMVQFPRDLYVPIDGGAENKINSALEGGKGALVRTVEDLTGLDINKYAQVNIAGFRDVVDAIGGVDLCITEPIPFDSNTGIEVTQDEIDESPMIHFNGERALRYVRARHVFPGGDFDRIANQQRFLAAAIGKVTSVGTLFSPTRISRLLDAAGKNIRVDSHTTPKGLYDISKKFRNFNPDDYEAYTAPNFGVGSNEAGSVVLPDYATMEVMFEAMANNTSPKDAEGVIPPDIDMPSIRLGVYNGTFEEGVATKAADMVKEATQTSRGTVTVADIANADKINYRKTFIVYDPSDEGSKEKAEIIAQAVPNAELREGNVNSTVDVELIVGKEGVETQKLVQIVPIEIPEPSELPAACR